MEQSSDSPAEADANAAYEETHVHAVYDQIASHFSSTRYKPWPLVSSFLGALAPGSVGLDIGCGNGKYLAVNPTLYTLGSDRAPALVDFAAMRPRGTATQPAADARAPPPQRVACDALVADVLALPHAPGRFDFAICIAVVHHLSTRARRVAAVRAVLDTLRPAGRGRALLYVWALEQAGSRRGWDAGGAQDVMVPWVMKGAQGQGEAGGGDRTFHRYYHLYRRGELEEDVGEAGGTVLESGYERDNWWAVATVTSERL